jgi:uncharacterized protein involved in outer membrane biogenesis
MAESGKTVAQRARAWISRVSEFSRSRRLRRIVTTIVAVILFLGVATWIGVPIALRHVINGQVAAALHRPVSVGRIRFNLYTLRLDIEKLHIGEPTGSGSGSEPFVDIGHLGVRASWTSILRLAPIVREVAIDQPAIHLVRMTEQRFNFSDLIESSSPPPATPKPPGKPFKFAVSNIQLNDGDVSFDDQVLKEHHAVTQIRIAVPFIANLPADVDTYVQPLVQMVIDGSPLKVDGNAKPFSSPPESLLDLNLHRLDLSRYAQYLPARLGLKVPRGSLSCAVQIHFVAAEAQPIIRLNGAVALDQIETRDRTDAPLLGLAHAEVKLIDVEPLGGVVHLDKIRIDGLAANLALNADGTTNLTPIIGGSSGGNTGPAAAQPQAAATATPAKPPPDVTLGSFELAGSSVKLTDNAVAPPQVLVLGDIRVGLNNLHLSGPPPATFEIGTKLGGGGAIALKGALDLAGSQVTSEVSLDQIDLPALQGFAQPFLVASLKSGKLSAKASVRARFGGAPFNVHAEPASVSIDNFDLRDSVGREQPVGWTRLSVNIANVDLAGRRALVNEVRTDGLHVFVRREANGALSLASLMKPSAPASHLTDRPPIVKPQRGRQAQPSTAEPPWQYRVESVAIEKTEARFEDDTTPRPAQIAVAPLNIHLKDISSDLGKPITVDLDGTLNGKGGFAIGGTVAPVPLTAKLHVSTKNLELAAVDPYVSSRLNVRIAGAALTMNGALGVAIAAHDLKASYRGDATLGRVNINDKLTGDKFLRWKSLSVSRINFALGSGPTKVHIGGLALADFYAKIILNRGGKLNLKDIVASPQSAPTSVTRANPGPAAETAAPAANPAGTAAAQPVGADIALGRITLQGGKVDYTDNFIQPNYAATLRDIGGSVGRFGTDSPTPAAVTLQANVNGSAPVEISGSVNPLAPAAFIDLNAKANGVELTGLTPYATKYTGYPIVKGTLTVDVHYLLDHQKLTADNHIVIDQLTFGDRVANSTATNLPVRLAVALLKDADGKIDLKIPISGSLSDPKFSVGGLILGTVMNLIAKAATSPFSLLGAAIGGVVGGGGAMGVIEFAPGYALVTPDSQKKLDAIAVALQGRPSVRLDISGRVDPAFDRAGLREAKLVRQIKAQKLKSEGEDAGASTSAVALTPAEYDKYLTRVYAAATFPKPTNFIGLNKSLPSDEMKKLLVANTQVSDKDLQSLAGARASAVRQALSAKIDPARLFVIAPKLDASGIKDQHKTTRADLSLD